MSKKNHARIHKRVTGEELTGDLAADELKFYNALQERIQTTLTEARSLCSAAYKKGDQETVWVMQAMIKDLERKLANMRKPTTQIAPK